jgi:NAD(P)-dependent dehydrogenase (short-subunit alcohol dehydrogenase family)
MAREGAMVLAVDVNERGMSDLTRESEGTIHARRCDVASDADVRGAVADAVDRFGGLHICCNCAAVLGEGGPLLGTSDDDWRHVMAVNVLGVFHGCKYAIAAMRESGEGGSVINWGSTDSLFAEYNLSPYVASKGAVLMLTRAAAIEHARERIRVNCICPGAIETPMAEFGYKRAGGRDAYHELVIAEGQLLGIGTPEQIASIAVFLASDESSFITGAAIMADGGYTAM